MTDLFRNSVPVAFIEVIRDRLAKFTRRCVKSGMPVPTLNLGEVQRRPTDNINAMHPSHDATCPTAEFIEVWMTGDTPRIGPWELVASIDNVEGKPFFRPVPEREVPERFRSADPTACDYCKKNIVTRTETFIVYNTETDEYKQVGRQCIRDFLGWNIDTLTRWYESVASMGDEPEGGWGGYVRPTWTPLEVIRIAAKVVSVDGFYKKAFENDNDSTKSKVWEFLSPPRNASEQRWYQDFITKYNSQPEQAERIFNATVAALATLNTSSDWAYNVVTATSAEYIGAKQVGVVASSVILGLRALELQVREQAQKKAPSQHVGTIGERVTVTVTVLDERNIESRSRWADYTSVLYTMQDEAGNIFKTFVSGSLKLTIGEQATITGTVKKHDEWKGQKQTVLTRCKKV